MKKIIKKNTVILIVFCYLILIGISFLRPMILKVIMDEGIIKKNIRLIIYLSLSLTALISIEEVTSILQTKLFADFQNKFVLSLYIKVGQILYRAKQDYFTNNSSTEIINKLSTDINSVSTLMDSNIMYVLGYVLQIISGVIGLFVINWKLAFLIIIVVPIKYLLIKFFSEKAQKLFEKEIDLSSKFSAWFGDIINGIREVKLWNLYEEKQKNLTIATIYSYAQNEEDTSDGILDDEGFETDLLDKSSREFLDFAINEYNKKFKTNFSSEGNGFQDYYKDLSDKVKHREIDLLIVVNMFLTGFDATTLNTLWVDKNLKQHGLIQAYSRTNRILNSVKTYGNIVCFRNLQDATNDAIALFGDKNATGIVLLKSYEDYYYGYEDDNGKKQIGYEERIAMLLQKYPLGVQIVGEKAEKDFIVSIGNILRLRNILSSFDKFAGNEILSERDFQDYTGMYVDLYQKYKQKDDGKKESIKDDIVFEMELVKQVEVNIDYILMLVAKYHQSNCEDKEILGTIDKAIKSSLALRSKKELIQMLWMIGVNL